MAVSRTKNPAGFTLIEVIIVLIILVLMAGIVVPSVVGVLEQQQKRATEVQLKSVADALDQFRVDIGRLPSTDEWPTILWVKPEGEDTEFANYRDGGYLKTPLGKDPWGNDYVYEAVESDEAGNVKVYRLRSFGPNKQDDAGENDDICYPKPLDEEGMTAS